MTEIGCHYKGVMQLTVNQQNRRKIMGNDDDDDENVSSNVEHVCACSATLYTYSSALHLLREVL